MNRLVLSVSLLLAVAPVWAQRPASPAETENANDNPQARLQEKMQKFHAGLQKWQQEGRDLSPIMSIMPEFEPLMRQGKLPEAEALLDRAIKILGSAAKIQDEDVSGGKVGPFDRAQWIWCAGEEVPKNFYLYCRKTFTLKENVASATIHATADSRYKLYVNGTFVGRGPARADQRWQYYDSYDVASHLRAGENVIAAMVHQYGVPTHSYTLGRGGFLLQGEAGGQILDTGRSWKVLPSPAWQRPTPRISPAIMWMEVYDARKEPAGWKRAGFDDSGWSPARELGRPPVNPWKNLIPRDIPFLLEQETFPTKILDQGTVEPIEEKDVARRLAREPHHPGPTPGLKDAGKLLKSGDGPAVVCTDKADVYATIDFGKEVSGYVRLRLKGVAGGIVDLGYSEVLRDGRVDVGREGPWGFADRYIMRDGPQEWELFFWKGFRYLQLTFRNCPKPVEVESASLLFTSYPVQYRGHFECSDANLNRIWEVGRWTLQLCMHDGYEDTPWREQGQWVGDAQVELMANYMTFGDVALGSKCLRQIAEGQAPNGSLPAMYPAAAMPFDNGIPTFMCQWVSSLLDHYRYTGERKLVAGLYPNVKRLMGYFDRYLDDHGLLAGVPGFVFLDWSAAPPSPSGVELTGLNCHYYRALMDAAELASMEKDEAKRTEWLGKAQRLKQSLNRRLWSEERGVYLPGLSGDKPLPQLTVHDTVLAIWSGVASPERIQRGLAALREADPQEFSFIGTPYFYYFYLGALRRAGEHREAVEVTRAAYGEMLQKGATSWWEHFSGEASRSHAWSCAPSFDLPAYVLGVQPTKPGFAEFRIEPHPSGLDWAKGTVPTVRGEIKVQWKRDGQEVELGVDVPMKARAELVLPADRRWVTGPGSFRLKSAMAKDKPASPVKTLITRRDVVVRPGQGEPPPPSLQEKMQKLQAGVQKWQQEGRDLSPVGRIMQDFEPLMRQGKLPEAEAVLDRALERLRGKTMQGPKQGVPPQQPGKEPRATKPRPTEEKQGGTEPQYLLFQLFTYMCHGSQAFNKTATVKIVDEILESLEGLRGDGKTRHLGFAWGPLTLDQTDDEVREIIREAFRIADEKEVAVAFHIDDSMFWRRRSDLWRDAKNVEWTDWQGTVHPQRYVEWARGPKLAPQMCYNSPAIRKEISRIVREVIGAEVNKGIAALKARRKEHLFAGVIAGWETLLADFSTYGAQDPPFVEQMKRDGSPRVRIGYNALTNLGFSQANPPKDIQRELDKVVHDWAEFWAKELNQAGIPKDRVYTHFASRDWKAFNSCSRPGFTAYDKGSLAAIYQALAQNGGLHWAMSEGTNLDEAAQGVTWEAYLGGIFNHGGTLATIFAWHEQEASPYGRATNSKGAIAAYKKFLKGERLSEEVRESELTNLQRKTRQISAALPAYVGKGGDAAKVMPLVQKLGQCFHQGKREEAEKAADEILELIKGKDASGAGRVQ